MARQRYPVDAGLEKAWAASREARITMRLLVQSEQAQVRDAYGRAVDALRDAYDATGNPGFALLALRPLQPCAPSHTGRSLQYTHAPDWAIRALARATEQASPSAVKQAEQLWLATERETTRTLRDVLERCPEREVARVLRRWFSTEKAVDYGT